jgi:hypothetical protein
MVTPRIKNGGDAVPVPRTQVEAVRPRVRADSEEVENSSNRAIMGVAALCCFLGDLPHLGSRIASEGLRPTGASPRKHFGG